MGELRTYFLKHVSLTEWIRMCSALSNITFERAILLIIPVGDFSSLTYRERLILTEFGRPGVREQSQLLKCRPVCHLQLLVTAYEREKQTLTTFLPFLLSALSFAAPSHS